MTTVKIIADSISPSGVRLTTYELTYPRFIHAEIMTHRVFSRNAQSSRAVPVDKMLNLDYIKPIVWGKNKAGMSSTEVLDKQEQNECEYYWHSLVRHCREFSKRLSEAGLHKQWANRCLEWFTEIKVVVTATEWDNFFWLRDDPEAAQPEIVDLTRKMASARASNSPRLLQPGQWHLPYVECIETASGQCYQVDGQAVDLETAKMVSTSCCAQVSYRNLDTSLGKALAIYNKLFTGPKPHLSPTEHQATPTNPETDGWETGITHLNRDGSFWSANFREWIQYRQLL